MSTTNFPYGVTSFGIPVVGSGTQIPVTNGNYYWVDGTNGVDGNPGLSPKTAVKTIANAVSLAKSNDVILVASGTYVESAMTISVANLSIIGINSSDGKDVVVSSATDTDTITVNAVGCEIGYIYFKPPVNTSPSTTFHSSIVLGTGASYLNVHDCRFQGQTNSVGAIYSAVPGSDNVTISNNQFMYMNTLTYGFGIYAVDAASSTYSAWRIANNTFNSCVIAIKTPGRVAEVYGNHISYAGVTAAGVIGNVTTTKLTVAGQSNTGDVGGNQVHGNYFGGTYSVSGGYVSANADDDWAGNYNIAGLTTALPA